MKKPTESFESVEQRANRIDQSLRYLIVKNAYESAEKGEAPKPMTQTQIADFCGCDRKIIDRAEKSALAKLKSHLWELEL